MDLLSDNLFENLINSAEPNSLLVEGEPAAKKRIILTDHDYVAHMSPTTPSEHSDSGISNVSDDSSSSLHTVNISPDHNMTDDQLEFYVSRNLKNEPSEYSPKDRTPSSSSDAQTFDLFDFIDNTDHSLTEVHKKYTHTVDTTTADLEDFDFNFSNEDNVSIDFGKQEVCVFLKIFCFGKLCE